MTIYKKFYYIAWALILALGFASCELEDIEDPNNPSLEAIEKNATLAEIQNVVDGIQAGMRNNLPIYYDGIGAIGREFWRFSGSDPRYTTDLLGGAASNLDPGAFYTTNAYGSRYRVVKTCNILETAIANTSADLTEAQKRAANGFSKTIKAHELLLAFNQQWTNGIRVDVADPDRLGPFLDKNGSLSAIAKLLDDGSADLAAGGASFPFILRGGFSGFDNPTDFNKFNRALAARVAAYSEQWDACITALNASFLDKGGNFELGCYNLYSKTGGDLLNELYQAPTAVGEIRIVHPGFIADAEGGDARLSKAFKRADKPTQAGLEGEYGFNVYASNTSPIAIIRNEELILLWAEANAQKSNVAEAVSALNVIRKANGLRDFTTSSKDEAITEMLKQRRYSLYGEGHRWVDMRRYGRLGELPKDRADDDVWEKFPRPTNE